LNFEMLAEIVNCCVRIERASLLRIRSVICLLQATTVQYTKRGYDTVVDPINKYAYMINHDRYLLLLTSFSWTLNFNRQRSSLIVEQLAAVVDDADPWTVLHLTSNSRKHTGKKQTSSVEEQLLE
jgi:hypothetical protein